MSERDSSLHVYMIHRKAMPLFLQWIDSVCTGLILTKLGTKLDSSSKGLFFLPKRNNILKFLLRSSVSDGRPYSDCTVYYYFSPVFCQGDFSEMTGWIYLKFSRKM